MPAGAPTMLGFLDKARGLRRHALAEEDYASFDAVLDSLRELSGIYEKSYLDLNNLEEVFGAIEMAELVGKLADMPRDQIQSLRKHFVRMVVRTLQLSTPIREPGAPPEAMGALAEGVRAAIEQGVGLSIISFNYDLLAEMSLKATRLGYFYGLPDDGARPTNQARVPLLKLHGSINWHFCEQCHAVYDAGAFTHSYERGNGGYIAALNHPVAHSCRTVPDATPIIVPPSWDKSRYQTSLRQVWEHAAEVLATADEIYVIGYSLPEADSFFRYLFALGTQSRTRVQRMLVVNPDERVKPKFERFIGQGLRPQLQFFGNGYFEQSVQQINYMLRET